MRQISLLLWSWIETTRNLGRGRLWAPLLLLAIAQWLVLLLLTQFHQPILTPVLAPLIRLLVGEPALHYPVFYQALPELNNWFSIVLDVVLGAWLIGAAFLLFWQADRPGELPQGGISRAAGAYGKLVAARLPLAILVVAILFLLPRVVFAGQAEMSGSTQRFVRFATILVGSILEGLFLYAPLAILVEGRGVKSALSRSFSFARRMPLATAGAVFFPNLIQIPVSYVLRRSDEIIRKLSPEMIGWVLFLMILVFTVVAFYVVGAGSRLFRVQAEESRA
ncbi:MAG: hypothetical protein ACE15D_05625 [Candidatus Eisenbacteria bacterium]|nr:hypothetical protein [Candidatus Eisenbacteria bacterium]